MLASNLRNTTLSPCQDFFQNINVKNCLCQWRGSHNKFPSNAVAQSFSSKIIIVWGASLSLFPLSASLPPRARQPSMENERNKPANPLTFFKYLNDIGLRQTRGEERRFFPLDSVFTKGARACDACLPARERTAEKLTAIPLYPCTPCVCSLRLVLEADEPLFPPPPTLAALLATSQQQRLKSALSRAHTPCRPLHRFNQLPLPNNNTFHLSSEANAVCCSKLVSFNLTYNAYSS